MSVFFATLRLKVYDCWLACLEAAFPSDRPSPLFGMLNAIFNGILLVWGCALIFSSSCSLSSFRWVILGIIHAGINMLFAAAVMAITRYKISKGIPLMTSTFYIFALEPVILIYIGYLIWEITWIVMAMQSAIYTTRDECGHHIYVQVALLVAYLISGTVVFACTFMSSWGSTPEWRERANTCWNFNNRLARMANPPTSPRLAERINTIRSNEMETRKRAASSVHLTLAEERRIRNYDNDNNNDDIVNHVYNNNINTRNYRHTNLFIGNSNSNNNNNNEDFVNRSFHSNTISGDNSSVNGNYNYYNKEGNNNKNVNAIINNKHGALENEQYQEWQEHEEQKRNNINDKRNNIFDAHNSRNDKSNSDEHNDNPLPLPLPLPPLHHRHHKSNSSNSKYNELDNLQMYDNSRAGENNYFTHGDNTVNANCIKNTQNNVDMEENYYYGSNNKNNDKDENYDSHKNAILSDKGEAHVIAEDVAVTGVKEEVVQEEQANSSVSHTPIHCEVTESDNIITSNANNHASNNTTADVVSDNTLRNELAKRLENETESKDNNHIDPAKIV